MSFIFPLIILPVYPFQLPLTNWKRFPRPVESPIETRSGGQTGRSFCWDDKQISNPPSLFLLCSFTRWPLSENAAALVHICLNASTSFVFWASRRIVPKKGGDETCIQMEEGALCVWQWFDFGYSCRRLEMSSGSRFQVSGWQTAAAQTSIRVWK